MNRPRLGVIRKYHPFVQQREASEQAAQALSISTMLYEQGLENYLSVSVQALAARTTEVQIKIRQGQAAASLIRALVDLRSD